MGGVTGNYGSAVRYFSFACFGSRRDQLAVRGNGAGCSRCPSPSIAATAADCVDPSYICRPNRTFAITFSSSGSACTWTDKIAWGDGKMQTVSQPGGVSKTVKHTYALPGFYTVQVSWTGVSSDPNITCTPGGTQYKVEVPEESPDTKLTHQQAVNRLRVGGITEIRSRGHCSDPNNRMCTALVDIRARTIDRLIEFKKTSGLNIIVTGGTEVGHSAAHRNGYKIDIDPAPAVTNYITSNFTYAGKRLPGDGAKLYKDARGNVYADERFKVNGPHWDILYMN